MVAWVLVLIWSFELVSWRGQYHLASLLYVLGYFLQMIYLFSSDVSLIQWSLDSLVGSFKDKSKTLPQP